MIFDVGSNATGSSLNDCLHSGPSLSKSLFGVLLRFHLNNIAFISDRKNFPSYFTSQQ